eukprot:CAMPEP_0114465370 /NCGR_PEP_ID=MMETSP0104-20121206/8461_1 /TAXON_ID=37642 ORGANISM="Paraphysomonas imperforata, Strain PA2" /NCGR_SAMPLE_ID=MMETSP0104 /ASSEMBLY_ACC=CAM_ASM_000202 /LENGTH=88 /DNA_ID=CAMNT_0001638581 /DNA_START=578 /DNA_END=841 /DNA_ORIENTATION=-
MSLFVTSSNWYADTVMLWFPVQEAGANTKNLDLSRHLVGQFTIHRRRSLQGRGQRDGSGIIDGSLSSTSLSYMKITEKCELNGEVMGE